MKKTLCSLLALMMLLACTTVSAFAATPIASAELEQGYILNRGVPIGTLADDEGVPEPATRASGLPFSMTANGVTGLLTTYSSSGKNFNGGAFDAYKGTGLSIKGTLTHTKGSSIKVGACYYDTNSGIFNSVASSAFSSGSAGSTFFSKLDGKYLIFNNNMTYYGHITNSSGSGSISGSLDYAVATK